MMYALIVVLMASVNVFYFLCKYLRDKNADLEAKFEELIQRNDDLLDINREATEEIIRLRTRNNELTIENAVISADYEKLYKILQSKNKLIIIQKN